MGDVFALSLPVVIGKEVLVGDSVHVYVSRGFDRGSDEVGFVVFGISGEGTEQFLRLVKGFLESDSFLGPVDGGVGVFQPRES